MQEKKLALTLLCGVLLCHAVVLWPEVPVGRLPANDNLSHLTLLEDMVQAAEHGENPLDYWNPECALGSAFIRTYQPLVHGLVTLVYFALLKSVSLATLFVWARYLSILAVPLAFFTMASLLELPPLTAAAAALLSPLIASASGNPLGLELRSWLTFGVFPQCVATSLLLVTLGLLYQAIRKGRRPVLAGAMLGLTCLAHLMYGWMGALTACLLALMPDPVIGRIVRIRRTVVVGSVAFVLTAFLLAPIVRDGYFMNHAHWEPAEKWDSFGAGQVLAWLFTGQLMDANRLPVLSLLALLGACLQVWSWRKTRKLAPAAAFVLLGAAFWILVFFGRPTWGPLLLLLGVTADFHLHRVNAFVQLFLLMLAAIGLAAIWRELSRRGHAVLAAGATVLLLIPMVHEQTRLIADDVKQNAATQAAYDNDQTALDQAVFLVNQRGGRVYAGLPETWGNAFKVGTASVAGVLSTRQLPVVGFVPNTTALTADLRFDEVNPALYRLFNIRSLVAPPLPGTPAFLTPVRDFGRFRVLAAPGDGYFDLVDAAAVVAINRYSFYDVTDRWLHSDWLAKKQYLWLDLTRGAAPSLPRLSATSPLPPARTPDEFAGTVRDERQTGQVYQAELDVSRPCFALFKMTWHPNWVVYIDGNPRKTAMLSPGFLAVPVTPGHHQILCRYEPGKWRLYLAMAGFVLVGLIAGVEWRKTPGIPASQPPAAFSPPPVEAPRKKRSRGKGRQRYLMRALHRKTARGWLAHHFASERDRVRQQGRSGLLQPLSRKVQIAARRLVSRIRLQRGLELFDRARQVPGSHQNDPEVVVQIGAPRLQLNQFPVVTGRGFQTRLGKRSVPECGEGRGQMLPRRGIVRNGGKHLAKTGGRFFQFALGGQRVGQVEAGVRIAGLHAKRVPELLRGLLEPAVRLQRHPQGIQRHGLLRFAAQCVPQVGGCGGDLPPA